MKCVGRSISAALNIMAALNIFMRFLHILSAVTLAGGALAWRFSAIPATAPLADDTRRKVGDALARTWRPFVLASIAGILISGIYNFLRKTNLPPAYHAVFGIKVLLALHVIAVLFLATQPGNEKRARQLTGVAFSAIAIVILSAVLRWLTI
jgi:uncharacterized membrane protein